MEKIKKHLVARMAWLIFALALSATRILEGIQEDSIGKLLTGLGWLLLGALWFLSPLIIGKAKGAAVDQQREAAIGSDSLRNKLLFAAVGCVGVGMVLRYGFGM